MSKIFLIIIVASVISNAAKKKSEVNYEKQRIYLMSVQCNSSEKIVYQNMSCRAKSFNRTFSTGTFVAYTKMPIYSVFVSIILKTFDNTVILFWLAFMCHAIQVWTDLSRCSSNPTYWCLLVDGDGNHKSINWLVSSDFQGQRSWNSSSVSIWREYPSRFYTNVVDWNFLLFQECWHSQPECRHEILPSRLP